MKGVTPAALALCWLSCTGVGLHMPRGKPPRKGGEHNSKDHLQPSANRRQAWAENGVCATTCAVHSQTNPPRLPLDDS